MIPPTMDQLQDLIGHDPTFYGLGSKILLDMIPPTMDQLQDFTVNDPINYGPVPRF